jgi:hypothetical protein
MQHNEKSIIAQPEHRLCERTLFALKSEISSRCVGSVDDEKNIRMDYLEKCLKNENVLIYSNNLTKKKTKF